MFLYTDHLISRITCLSFSGWLSFDTVQVLYAFLIQWSIMTISLQAIQPFLKDPDASFYASETPWNHPVSDSDENISFIPSSLCRNIHADGKEQCLFIFHIDFHVFPDKHSMPRGLGLPGVSPARLFSRYLLRFISSCFYLGFILFIYQEVDDTIILRSDCDIIPVSSFPVSIKTIEHYL